MVRYGIFRGRATDELARREVSTQVERHLGPPRPKGSLAALERTAAGLMVPQPRRISLDPGTTADIISRPCTCPASAKKPHVATQCRADDDPWCAVQQAKTPTDRTLSPVAPRELEALAVDAIDAIEVTLDLREMHRCSVRGCHGARYRGSEVCHWHEAERLGLGPRRIFRGASPTTRKLIR